MRAITTKAITEETAPMASGLYFIKNPGFLLNFEYIKNDEEFIPVTAHTSTRF